MQSGNTDTGEAIPLKTKGRKSRETELVATTYEFAYMRKPTSKSFGQLIYDRQQGKLFGRTPKNWGELLIFYTIFYIGLCALFAICLKGLFLTINKHEPKWKLSESLIGTNPGLGFRPIAHDVDQGSLIWYDSTNQTQVNYWVDRVDEFLSDYKISSRNQKECSFDALPSGNQVCKLDLENFGECTRNSSYGYSSSKPCIFLKLNRIYGWKPEYYNDSNDLPEDMPQSLKDHIAMISDPAERNQVWITCEGEDGSDREILGPTAYYPTRGFPSYFYPYTNLPGYVSPLIAVQFQRPQMGQIINIECRTWAKNIRYSGSNRDRMGSVHFELQIDNNA